jgi:Tol biopolymer transport system component
MVLVILAQQRQEIAVTVTAPPRPPRPSDPLDRDELEALVEALIEEARQRARRRRRIYSAAAAVVALGGAVVFTVFDRAAQSQTASPAPTAQTGAPAVAGRARIAFTRNTGPMSGDAKELYVMNADGSGQKRLARISSYGVPPAWSADGRRLAFVRGHGPNAEIYVVNSDGSGQRRLTRTSGWEVFPVWSPEGRKIAFLRWGDPEHRGLYVINADGSGQRKLADKALFAAPDWSPDGRKIAFVSNRGGPTWCTWQPGCNTEIWVMNADGSGQRNLTRNPAHDSFLPEAITAQHSAWSPDGRKLVFVSDRDGRAGCSWQPGCNTEIWVMNADGSGQRNLTRNPARDDDPAWSPDGRKIAFVSRRDGKPEVYVMNADGSGQRNLTRNPGRDSAPAWSPDGRTIAFHSNRDRNTEIYVMNADGSGQRNLTRYRNHDGSFAWSPAQKK